MTDSAPSPEPISRLLIVGGGSAGWMAAMMLSRTLGRTAEIGLIESEAVGIVGVGEATIPPIRQFNRFCGVDEAEFLRATQGTFKTGIQFEGWGRPGEKYIHAFGRVGQELDAVVKLHHWWRMGQAAGLPDYPRFEDLYLGRAATDLQRFGFDPRNPGQLAQLLPHAYHFDAIAYGQFLRGQCEANGVKRIEGLIAGVERDSETGNVTSVTLEDGRMLAADLFIDCSGFRSILLGEALEEPFDDWSHWLPADRAVVAQSEPTGPEILPATRAIAHPVGWQWRIPLQRRIGNGHVYASSFSSDEEAEARLLATIEGVVTTDPRILRFRTGRRKQPWSHNVVALGLAAGFLEPLESTSIHLVQSGIERLVDLFPSRRIDPLLRDRFNAQSELEWSQVRDLIIAHYKVNQREDSDFWRHCAAMDVPDSLAETLALWEGHGRLAIDGGHLFQLGSWAQVLIGQNLQPQSVHPLTSRADAAAIAPRLRDIARGLRQQAERLPDHAAFLQQYCAMQTS
ncbi:tryptophan halogenase family protein [Altererythrobacter sp. GH1-8]|uniref:tryptophan halogenase family protein n=1 Tax=Altererythrobacter sp. GH1-8 TaxID=3349333 RepID=UPI00374DE962